MIGFMAALALLGCRRVASALWSLYDGSAPEFTRHWIRAIKKHVFDNPRGPHSFAVAFKEALTDFRRECPQFDHEFFWAPYTLHGLG